MVPCSWRNYSSSGPMPLAGDTHHRALANRLVGIIHGCLRHGTLYDDTPPGATASRKLLDNCGPVGCPAAATGREGQAPTRRCSHGPTRPGGSRPRRSLPRDRSRQGGRGDAASRERLGVGSPAHRGIGFRRRGWLNMLKASKPHLSPADGQTRGKLANLITAAAIGGITVASALAIGLADTDMARAEMARLVFASVLPLFGTWVGTVLAFYFAKENLQAATDSTLRLAGRRDPATPVAEVMIPRSKITSHDLLAGADPASVPIAVLRDTMHDKRFRRIPILSSAGAVIYVVHDSTIAKYAEAKQKRLSELSTETMGDLLADAELKAQVEAIGLVAANADLGQARAAMRSLKGCNDVFVTQDGRRDDPVVGWITNTELAGLEDS